MTAAVVIAPESPRQDEVRTLVKALDAAMTALYHPDSNHFLDIEALAGPTIRFFVARQAGHAVGCAALRIDPSGYGEVKRMFVTPAARGLKIGRGLLDAVEAEARRHGLPCLRLETGRLQPEAIGLYQCAGFVECAAFAPYLADPASLFMEKPLG